MSYVSGPLHGNYKHGRRSGYTDFRYGSKPIAKPQAIHSKDKRRHIVNQVIEAMRDWRQTPFEQEGTIRAGLRSGLCLRGYSWDRSDAEAAAIVSEALRILGAQRPTWAQAQPEYTIPREKCANCGGPLDDEDIANRYRFCSNECRVALKEKNRDSYKRMTQRSRAWAHYVVTVEKSPLRTCEQCSKPFKSRDLSARFCSHQCFLKHQSARTIEKNCDWCGKSFMAGNPCARFCSKSSGNRYSDIDSGKVVPKRLNPPVFDYFMKPIIRSPFTPQRFDAVFAVAV